MKLEEPRSIEAEKLPSNKERGEPKYWNEKGQNESAMRAEMRAQGVDPSGYKFTRIETEVKEVKQDEGDKFAKDKLATLSTTLIEKIDQLIGKIGQIKTENVDKVDLQDTAEKVKKELAKLD